MKAISKTVWTHNSPKTEKRESISDVRESHALEVATFRDLVQHLAHIACRNPEFSLFFRGQDEDFRTKEGKTKIYPSLYRGIKIADPMSSPDTFYAAGEKTEALFRSLDMVSKELLQRLRLADNRIDGLRQLSKYPELGWALLQHYEVCETPLIDVTHSLRVAASFALENRQDGYVFVIGMPHVTGSITYSVEEELQIIKLLSICPPQALRPYYQEGFMVGSFPTGRKWNETDHDVARRLIAKFRLKGADFWDRDFSPIPHDALFPKADPVGQICRQLRKDIKDGTFEVTGRSRKSLLRN